MSLNLAVIKEGERIDSLLTPAEDEIIISEDEVTRDKILFFQDELSKVPGVKFGDSDLCPLKHSFSDGIYVREIFIPKGTVIVGKIHKHSHPNFLMQGEVTVLTESGGKQRLKAPLSMISQAGTKRVVYAHEDTVWITIHVTNETDLVKIEEQIIAKDFDEFDSLEKAKELQKELEGNL